MSAISDNAVMTGRNILNTSSIELARDTLFSRDDRKSYFFIVYFIWNMFIYSNSNSSSYFYFLVAVTHYLIN